MVRLLRWAIAAGCAGLLGGPLSLGAQTRSDPEALLVVYGQLAPSREGDVDRREQIFFSVPAGTEGRIYVRIFDPEVGGENDFTYGGPSGSETLFQILGGDAVFSGSAWLTQKTDGAREPSLLQEPLTPGAGDVLAERVFASDTATDGRWVTLGSVRASQGEERGNKRYFRIDALGVGGNDGNGFSVDVSLARDRSRPPEDLSMFNYQPTIRWRQGDPATWLWFEGETDQSYTVQNFDGARADLSVVTDFADIGLRASGQDNWTVDRFEAPAGLMALALEGGFETPNDVTLTLFDEKDAFVPFIMPPRSAPLPTRPVIAALARPLADCRSVGFDASATTGRVPLSFGWQFGDGQGSDADVISHRYDAPGRYAVRLRVLEAGDGPGRGAEVTLPVHVRDAPVAMPGARIVVAPGDQVAFDGSASQPSDSPITRYLWQFGDGAAAEGPRASHVFDAPGLYRAILRVEDGIDHPCNFGVATREVVVNTPPQAEAGVNQDSTVGQTVNLSAAASYDVDGTVSDYVWDMGDGTRLTGVEVAHSYEEPGTYTVALRITDDSGVANNSARDTLTIAVNAPPVPAFTIPDRPLAVAEVGELDATSSADADGVILSYRWDFGDGAMGDGERVNYAWARPGTYEVTLTVTDNSGTATATQTLTQIVLVDDAPVADAGPDQFVNTSDVLFDGGGSRDAEGDISTYQWAFGDGATGTGRSPRHAYARPGVYEVALTVRDKSGAPLNTDRDTMTVVINAAPIADAGPPLTVAPGEEFVLSGRGSVDPDGSLASYRWITPDGQSVEAERAAFTLSEPGLYRYTLEVTDTFRGGGAHASADVLITVNDQPVAVAGADVLIAPGDTVRLDGGQSFDRDGAIAQARWDFSDQAEPVAGLVAERQFETAGVWTAQLTVTDDSGVMNGTDTDELTIRVNHPPVAEAGPDIVSDGLLVTLDGGGSSDADDPSLIYTWDFGDGSPMVSGRVVTHAFAEAGRFPVTLRVDDGTGVSNATSVDATVVRIRARPLADAGGNREVCSGEPILFDASDSVDPDGGALLYGWDFGDGTTSDIVNPTKTYERPGVYPVTLTVRNESGEGRATSADRIAALVREGPISDAGPDLRVCTNQEVRFDGSGSSDADGAVNAFEWSFGDGNTRSGEDPVHSFARAGTYTVTLTITGDAQGQCSPLDRDSAVVEVIQAPSQQIATESRAAAGVPLSLSAQIVDLAGATVIGHSWDLGDGATAQGETISHSFAEPGVYSVTLTTTLEGVDADCGSLVTVKKITVNEAPSAVVEAPDAVAARAEVVFDASGSTDTDGAIIDYLWDFGDGGTARGVFATHRYTAPGRYDVTLSVRDEAGVANSRAQTVHEIVVNAAPVAALRSSGPVCPGQPTDWAVSGAEALGVTWQFGDTVGVSGAAVQHRFNRPGLYPVTVTMDDGSGLPNARRSEEIYQRVNAAPVAIAGPDRIICPGDTLSFDAGASADPDGQISEWIWRFSDGVTLSGPVVERTFDEGGPVDLTLTVRDGTGTSCDTGTDTARILVNRPPMVSAGPDLTVPVGAARDAAEFDATAASDPDGQGVALGWSFGDGGQATGAQVRHSYATPGRYSVTVTARDSTGLACGVSTDTAFVDAQARE